MKRIFSLILFVFTLLLCPMQSVKADFTPSYTNFTPSYTNSINHFGIGAARVTNFVEIYEKPDLNSKAVYRIYWNNTGNFITSNKKGSTKPSDIFLLYQPAENQVFLSVEDEDEEWLNVCYNQKKQLFGWLKKENGKNGAKFYSYKDLFFEYGKKYGLYTFRNLPETKKSLHSSPNTDSSVVDKFDYPKFISPWLIQGNWMLAKVVTMDNKTKTGWFNWRAPDGTLYGFVNVK